MSDSDRVTRLETHFEYVKIDLADLKVRQKDLRSAQNELSEKMNAILSALHALPTKDDLWSWRSNGSPSALPKSS